MRKYAAFLASNTFRLGAFLFLRILPHYRLVYILPTLYATYLIFWISSKPSTKVHVNGDATKVPGKDYAKKDTQGTSLIEVIKAVIFSVPTKSAILRHISLAINTALLFFVLDFVYFPVLDPARDVTFARIGAVYPDGAKVHVRYPFDGVNATELRVVYRLAEKPGVIPEAKWHEAPAMTLSQEYDWTNVTHITGLYPSTDYEYKLVLANESSVFLPYPKEALHFRTFPDPGLQSGAHFRFISTSCILPNYPYVPGNERRLKGFGYLADYLSSASTSPSAHTGVPATNESATSNTNETDNSSSAQQVLKVEEQISSEDHASVEFMLFLGDFIYADVPKYFGDDKEAYRRFYRRNYASPDFRKVYEKLPIVHIYDDHEFVDNFSGKANDSLSPYPNAASAFELYNGNANHDSNVKGAHYYTFRYGDAAFFVLDTRRYRSDVKVQNREELTMLGSEQMTALHSWLGAVNHTASFKFIISSVPFTSLWGHDAMIDSWAGYAEEKEALLKVLHHVPNVVILSGDRHEFAAIEFNAPGAGVHKVLEFSTSPLNMFYVPLYKTLNQASQEHVEVTEVNELGEKTLSIVPKERVIRYIPTGNHKWASIEVDSRNASAPILTVDIYIDGEKKYTHTVVGEPVQRASALAEYIPKSVKSILNNIGLKPDSWF